MIGTNKKSEGYAMEMSLSNKLELFVRRSRTIYTTYTKFRNQYYHTFYPEIREQLNVVTIKTDLCIEGFPRSGNTFLCNMVKNIDPTCSLASHKHSSGHVKEALNLGIPTIIVIRDPADAITSQLIWCTKNQIKSSLYQKTIEHYIQFYSYIEKVSNQVIIVDFPTLTLNPTSVLSKINSKLDLWPNQADYQTISTSALLEMKTKQITENVYKSCAPSKIRDKRKSVVKNQLFELFSEELVPVYTLFDKISSNIDSRYLRNTTLMNYSLTL